MLLPQFRSRHLAVAVAVLVGSVSCGSDDEVTAPVTVAVPAIKLSDNVVTLIRGSGPAPTKQVLSDSTVTWLPSPRPDIATISPTGLITAVGDGSTFFTAKLASNPSVNASVVVNVVSTIVSVSANSAFSWVGGPNRTATAKVTNNANTAVTWSSDNTAVATVSSTGDVTPVSAGTANITATSVGDPTKLGAVNFTVDAAPNGETLLTSGVGVSGLSGADGDQTFYRIVVPIGATSLTIATSGGTGDVDVFGRAGVRPPAGANEDYRNIASTACFSAGATAVESCTITNPQARIYYILVDSFGFANTTLTVTINP